MALMGKKGRIVLAATMAVLLASALSGCKKQNEPTRPPRSRAAEPNARTAALTPAAEPAAKTDVGKDIRILYVGRPGTDREKDFVDFLSKHFGTVAKGDWTAFAEAQCTGFDVTILDYDGDGLDAPHVNLSQGFSHPIITVGVPGAFVCSAANLKTGYQ